jgi:hypothetical protein
MHYLYIHLITGLLIATLFAVAFQTVPESRRPSPGARFVGYLLIATAWELVLPLLLLWPDPDKRKN